MLLRYACRRLSRRRHCRVRSLRNCYVSGGITLGRGLLRCGWRRKQQETSKTFCQATRDRVPESDAFHPRPCLANPFGKPHSQEKHCGRNLSGSEFCRAISSHDHVQNGTRYRRNGGNSIAVPSNDLPITGSDYRDDSLRRIVLAHEATVWANSVITVESVVPELLSTWKE